MRFLRNDNTKILETNKATQNIEDIRSQQIMQWLDLISIAITGMRELKTVSTEEELNQKHEYLKLFNENVDELEKFVNKLNANDVKSYSIIKPDTD